MFEQFTDLARKVILLSNCEAQSFNHKYIDTEHILLGLLKECTGVAAIVLKNRNIDPERVYHGVRNNLPSDPDMNVVGKLPRTPSATKVIEYAIEEAKKLDHDSVSTGHILLGLLRDKRRVTSTALANHVSSIEEVREEVVRAVQSNASELESERSN